MTAIQKTFEPMRHLIPRPKPDDEAVKSAARLDFAERILRWFHGNGDKDVTLESVLDDIEKVDPWPGRDGYELAKDFESYAYYQPDAELVDTLDDWSHCESDAHRKAVEKWVKECEIKPQLEPGTRVRVRDRTGEVEGVIQPHKEWNLSQAEYLVKRDTDGGPVMINGKPSPGSRTLGIHVNYEDVLEVVDAKPAVQ